MKKIYLTIFISILFISYTFAQETLAVMDFDADGVTSSEAKTLTNRFRDEITKLGRYSVIERNKMVEVLEEQGFQQSGCVSDECIVELGNLVGVKFIAAGSIGKVGNFYSVSTRIISVESGKIDAVANYDFEGNIGELLTIGMKKTALILSAENVERLNKEPTILENSGMVYVEGGTFQRGYKWGNKDEKPEHTVTVSGFFMDKTEVTQAEYRRVMGKNPSEHKGCDECPVENVSWHDAVAYAKMVGKRLPTEAEWEYAARGGNSASDYRFPGSNNLDEVAWWKRNSDGKTHSVGQKQPNELGLYDMSGNVWEWCSDWYDEGYYSRSPKTDPKGPNSGYDRVIRGGSSFWDDVGFRPINRHKLLPFQRLSDIGFRCVKDL